MAPFRGRYPLGLPRPLQRLGAIPGLSKLEGPQDRQEGRGGAFGAYLDLVRRARAGDPQAMEELVDRLRCVRRFLAFRNASYGRPLDAQELEDTLQETLLALWRKLDQYAGDGALEAWAYRFSCLEILKRIQAQERQPMLIEECHDAVPEPHDHGAEPGESEHVYLALERLGAQAEVVRLKHFETLTFEQIATRLGLPANTVKTRYYRSMERLRDVLRAIERTSEEGA